jgi:hypothetical protein
MYFSAPRWRGTSAVVDLRSAQKIRGLGLIDLSAVDPSGSTPCSQVSVPAGFVGPINCDSSGGGPVYAASQSQLASAIAQLQAQIAGQSSSPSWGTIALIGGGGLLFVVLLKALR